MFTEHKDSCLIGESNALGIFKTLFLFLQNHNFPKTAETLREEWGLLGSDGEDIEKVSNLSVLLTRCRCSRNQSNQTAHADTSKRLYSHDWLEGTFQGETFQIKQDDTRVFFVCDHCQQKRCEKEREELGKNLKTPNTQPISPTHNHKNLKCKFTQLQDDHQKLIAVTSELTSALQMNIIGQTKNIYSVLEHCKSIYPTLFDRGCNTQLSSFDSIPDEKECGVVNFELITDEEAYKETNNNFNLNSASQFTDASPLEIHIPQVVEENLQSLNLERLSPTSPLTPETVRLVLESVFQRVFEMDRSGSPERVRINSPLNKADIDQIVTDVWKDSIKSPGNCGAGEGDISSGQSEPIMRNSDANFLIDFTKVKDDLMHSDNERKIRILQALRWRITKNDTITRNKILESYIYNDILDLYACVSIPERLLLAYGSDHYVRESTCRLINTLASLKQGRDYLTIDERLLKRVLIRKVKDVRTVSGAVIRNMLVASVQKLSIRRKCRIQMVKEGLFEVMVDYLDEFHDKLSKYCLEYCSALLMNLCLVDQAKERSTKIPRKVVGLLRKFLEGKNDFCLPYINGVMFSLFEKEEIVSEATNQNLDKTIIKLTQSTHNESVKKQLDFIVQSRLFGKSDPNIHDDDEDGKEEVDLLEVELDQDDFITQLPSGEKLLQEYKTDSHTVEKSCQSVTFSTMTKREPSRSAKSFSEETKQFVHKPSINRGIFETDKPRRYSISCPQSTLRNFNRKTASQRRGHITAATPLCYLENCQKLLHGKNAQCSCSKCIPGQNKYSCGCYEAIKKEIADSNNDSDTFGDQNFRFIEPKNSQPNSTSITKSPSALSSRSVPSDVNLDQRSTAPSASVHPSIDKIIDTPELTNMTPKTDNNDGGRTRNGCKVCGEKKCECAFESRPKLCRTPTL